MTPAPSPGDQKPDDSEPLRASDVLDRVARDAGHWGLDAFLVTVDDDTSSANGSTATDTWDIDDMSPPFAV